MRSSSLAILMAGIGLAGQLPAQSGGRIASLVDEPAPSALQGNDHGLVAQLYRFGAVACGSTCLAEGSESAGGAASVPLGNVVPAAADGAGASRLQANQTGAQDNFYRQDSPETRYKASSYAPVDSWIYPVFDRLAAMGYIETGTASIRPQTRLELARLLAEAHEAREPGDSALDDLFEALDREFAHESRVIDGGNNTSATVESVYTRVGGVAGTPLRDGFHFGQTLVDDFGRPYGQGVNAISGASGHAEAGPFSVYLRGEYQYASAITPYSATVDAAISGSDEFTEAFGTGGGPAMPGSWDMRVGTTNRPRPVEAYVAMNLANWQISFGQQSLWWGPDRTTSLMLSNNAEAMPMVRLARAMPTTLPLLGWLGPVHFDSFFARQGGIHFVALGPGFLLHGSPNEALTPPPYLWGVTVSLEPTKNFEIGFGHTTIFAGYGRPLTFGTFLHSFSIYGNAQAIDPGKRVTEFNLYYHVPGLRKSLIVYTEGMSWDDPLQGSFLGRYALDPGVYLPHLPKMKRLDLRMEGVYTDLPGLKHPAYFYSNAHYPQGYTNYGQILGSWVGRQGSGGTATSTYWFSARTKAAVSYRKTTVDKSLLQGGNLTDLSASLTWLVRPDIEVLATEQFERWRFPMLSAGPKENAATSFEIRFTPKDRH